MEKHFPAPDRNNRVLRLLGLDGHHKSILDELGIDPDSYDGGRGASASKRKAAIEASARNKKKARTVPVASDSESGHEAADSDFEVNADSDDDDDDDDDDLSDSDVDADDYNPFGGSDNEDPWCRTNKKNDKAKSKAKQKKKEEKKKKKKEEAKRKRNPSDDDIQVIEPAAFTPPAIAAPPAVDRRGDIFNQPPPREAIESAIQMKERLLAQIEYLGNSLPPNTLDQLIDELGGPENVAEMTGRKGRVIQNDNGQVWG